MTRPESDAREQRVLILAPFGRDAELLHSALSKDGVQTRVCPSTAFLALELEQGAAAMLLGEEALALDTEFLADVISRQPTWSDLPVLLMTHQGADSPAVLRAIDVLGNVTLVERPVRVAALRSAVRSALRARQRQYQTRAYLREREEADRRKDEFLATLAHELRNPLAPIRSTVDILRMSGAGQPASHLWEMMDRQVGHMVRLVDDLLEVSRITRGKIELRKERVALADAIAAALETSRPLIESAGHELWVSLPPEPLWVEADAMRLGQVFSNLLNNAAKYTDPGGRITFEASEEDEHVVLTVTDTGIGIPSHALPKVFDLFVQANPDDERTRSGLGIGLTLVRSLVEMHGGTVHAHSDGEGKGSTFTVRLPLAAAGENHRPTAQAPASNDGKRMPRVLVVDDNVDAAESLGTLVKLLGAEVEVVHDGLAALQAVERHCPAVVFLDLGMPGMDGYEVARRMRKRPECADTVIVAVTGWGQEKDRRETRASGFDHHLTKPADISAIRDVLALRQSARAA